MKGQKTIRSMCQETFMECMVQCDVENGRLVRVRGDPTYFGEYAPFVCRLGELATEFANAPWRLKTPLKRKGERGENKWERITWDEAYKIIVDRLVDIKEKYGGTSITGIGAQEYYFTGGLMRCLLFALGSPNYIDCMDYCGGQRGVGNSLTIGEGSDGYQWGQDIKNSELFLIIGSNPAVSFQHQWHQMMLAKYRKSAKIVVVDPIFNKTAKEADLFLQIQPVTDDYLVAAMLNVIVRNGLFDKEFVEKWTNAPLLVRDDTKKLLLQSDIRENGSDEKYVVWDKKASEAKSWDPATREWPCSDVALEGEYRVQSINELKIKCRPVWQILVQSLEEFTPEKVADITNVPADKIREAAVLYAETEAACIIARQGVSQSEKGVQTCRLIDILTTITGHWDKPGTNLLNKNPGIKRKDEFMTEVQYNLGFLTDRELLKNQWGADKYPIFAGPDSLTKHTVHLEGIKAIQRGQAKAIINCDSNVFVSVPNTPRLIEGWNKAEFTVVIAPQMNPTAARADIVLPETVWYEENRLCVDKFNNCYYACEAAVEASGESRDHKQVILDLIHLLKKRGAVEEEKAVPYKTMRELYNDQLKDTGWEYDALVDWCQKNGPVRAPIKYREYEERPLDTPTGKFEIWSTVLEKFGYEPMPKPEKPNYMILKEKEPEYIEKYPLVALTALRVPEFFETHEMHLQATPRRNVPFPRLKMSTDAAEERGIKNGEWCWLKTKYGKIKMTAFVTEDYLSKVIGIPFGWWYPEKDPPDYGTKECSVNYIIPDDPPFDPITGLPIMKGVPCEVEKVPEWESS